MSYTMDFSCLCRVWEGGCQGAGGSCQSAAVFVEQVRTGSVSVWRVLGKLQCEGLNVANTRDWGLDGALCCSNRDWRDAAFQRFVRRYRQSNHYSRGCFIACSAYGDEEVQVRKNQSPRDTQQTGACQHRGDVSEWRFWQIITAE